MSQGNIYFDSSSLPAPSNEYVCWFDVMGTHSIMSRSVRTASNFIGKLHVAAIKSSKLRNVKLYPVMDGCYVSSPDQNEMVIFMRSVFSMCADYFISENNMKYRFMIRGGLAFGPIYHGSQITSKVSQDLRNNNSHANSLMFGIPMIQAHNGESKAPPFGIYVDESARAFSPSNSKPIPHRWYKWIDSSNSTIWNSMNSQISQYFDWCNSISFEIKYDQNRIDHHRLLAQQYFS